MGDSIGVLMMALLSLHAPPAHGASDEAKIAQPRARCVIAASAENAKKPISEQCSTAQRQPQPARAEAHPAPLAQSAKHEERSAIVR